MPRKKFKCPKCDRSFSMAAHLGRHVTTMHATKRKTKTASKKKSGKKKGARRMGPPTSIERKFAVRNMSLDQLGNLIAVARLVARDKIAEFENQL